MNRSNSAYKRTRKEFLKAREEWGGWYRCEACGSSTQAPEIDHIDRTGMGGSPSLLLDTSNWQLLCHDCHQKKDSGLKYV